MKKLLIAFTFLCFLLAFSNPATAQKRKSYKPKTVRVKSYTTKKGKRVKAHRRSRPSTYIMPMISDRKLVA